jgi:uncharacterized membrane protein
MKFTTIRTTAVVAACILVLAGLLWTMLTGWQRLSPGELILLSLLTGSLVFPLFSLLVRCHRGGRLASPRAMMWISIVWMMFSAMGIIVCLWRTLDDTMTFHLGGSQQALVVAVMMMFAAMFASALMQLASTADNYIREVQQRDRALHARAA